MPNSHTEIRTPTSDQLRANMVASQLRPNRVSDPRVVEAMSAIPRERFVPAALSAVAYVDEALEVAPDRYLMEPMVFARLLTAAEIQPDDHVLLVGCGTGYGAAVLGRLAKSVVAIESDKALADVAKVNLLGVGADNVGVMEAALDVGAAKKGPFSLIVIEGAADVIPESLIKQLAEDGRLIGIRNEKGQTGLSVGRGIVGRRSGTGFGVHAFMDAQAAILPGLEASESFSF